ncbi:MAG TPA: tetratricopeptide repeat protein [Williamwhitmania sp.]|nr:tetratricopeptide repeat protein [Williamwhitmania sp.]
MNLKQNIDKARNLADNYKIEEAKQLLNDILAKHPDSDEAYYILGNIARRETNFGHAINCYTKALEINPENTSAISAIEMLNEILAYRNTDLINP